MHSFDDLGSYIFNCRFVLFLLLHPIATNDNEIRHHSLWQGSPSAESTYATKQPTANSIHYALPLHLIQTSRVSSPLSPSNSHSKHDERRWSPFLLASKTANCLTALVAVFHHVQPPFSVAACLFHCCPCLSSPSSPLVVCRQLCNASAALLSKGDLGFRKGRSPKGGGLEGS